MDAYVDITATNGTCHFQIWGEFLPATVGPGGTLILTQTGTLGPPQAPPCDGRVSVPERPYFNFDTSEGPLDTIDPPFSNCNPSDSVVSPPVVTLVFSNGMTLTIVDDPDPDPAVQNDEILNTGGTDRFACTGTEEATPWTAVPPDDITRVG